MLWNLSYMKSRTHILLVSKPKADPLWAKTLSSNRVS